MGYVDLIKKVQEYSGFSDSESKNVLQLMVEILSVHLSEPERKEFAQQLPDELGDIALSVWATEENSREDILNQFMKFQAIPENLARKQISAAWRALKDTVSKVEIENIKAQLPSNTAPLLS
jgi:uncharacterized protein (DUF2267 family)